MKVAIDIQTTLGKPTGFGFYVSNLIEALKKQTNQGIELVLIKPSSEEDFSTPQRFIWDQFTYPSKAKLAEVDILHQPCFSAPLNFKKPVVVTIHDIISLLFPETIPFASRMFYSKWMPFSYRKASKIITISESTKKDIIRVLGIDEHKIKVIPLAYDRKFEKEIPTQEIEKVKKKYSLPKEYLLHIGTLEPRKNLDFLIEAFAEVISKGNDDLGLVITGKKGWYYEGLFEKVKNLSLEHRVIFTGYIDEVDKAAIYQGAKIFTFPSVYEGFGLPPLEAMASGIPVISSDTSSMPEVVGDAGILLSPYDKKGWIKAINELILNKALYKEMIQKNKEQIKKFDWDKTAKETIEVYKQVFEDEKK
jgi:glycosyltransferase involved in cell wall biosynthesis